MAYPRVIRRYAPLVALLSAFVGQAHAGPAQPAPSPGAASASTLQEQEKITWFDGPFLTARGRARVEGRWLFVYFWMEGSQHCDRLWQDTLSLPSAAAALDDFVCYAVNAAESRDARLIQTYGVTTLPTMLFVRPDGTAEDAILGFIPPSDFTTEIQRIESGFETVSELRQRCVNAPTDLDLRYRLATKLDFVGARAESQRLIDSILRDDPNGQTVVAARLALYEAQRNVLADASDPANPATFDLEPVYAIVRRTQHVDVQVEGWEWLASSESTRGERDAARRALAEAWKIVPARSRIDWGARIANRYFEERRELDPSEKAFALEVAKELVERAEELLEVPDAESLADLEIESEFEGSIPAYVARQLDVLARCYFMNGKKALAVRTVGRSIELDPGVSDHQALLDFFRTSDS